MTQIVKSHNAGKNIVYSQEFSEDDQSYCEGVIGLPKSFFLEPGLFARCGGLWYEPGILMVVEPGDHVEIFAARDGTPGPCKADYIYGQLDTREPPAGLRGDWRGRRSPSPQQGRAAVRSLFAPRARHAWANTPAFA